MKIQVQQDLPKVHGDYKQLYLAIGELIDNVIKFHGAAPVLNIYIEESHDEWILNFEDNGIGIPEDARNYVMDLFKFIHPHEKYTGTGFGLAFCKKILEHHHGDLRIASKSSGSRIQMFLPKSLPGHEG